MVTDREFLEEVIERIDGFSYNPIFNDTDDEGVRDSYDELRGIISDAEDFLEDSELIEL